MNCADPPLRYSAFQIVGAWANTGFSLVDQNLVPFQTAYPLLIFMIWLAVAGNTGFVSVIVIHFMFYSQPILQPILYVKSLSSMHELKEFCIVSLRLCVSVSQNVDSVPVSTDIHPCDADGLITGCPERDLNGERPSISY